MFKSLACLLLLFLSLGAQAQTYAVIGVGATPCHQYLKEKDQYRNQEVTWAQGYASAMNRAARTKTPNTSPVEAKDMLVLFCVKYPDKLLEDAAFNLYTAYKAK